MRLTVNTYPPNATDVFFSGDLAVVVAQLAGGSLLTPDIQISAVCVPTSVNCYPEKTKLKKKRPGIAHFFWRLREGTSGFDCGLKTMESFTFMLH